MFQNGDFPITLEQMVKSALEPFPYPSFTGITVPSPAATQLASAPLVASPANSGILLRWTCLYFCGDHSITGGAALPPPAAYRMTVEDKMRYDTLFSSYDTDSDGLVLLTVYRILLS